MESFQVSQDGQNVLLPIIVRPNAPRSAIIGIHDGCLRLSIKGAPEHGKANTAVIRFFASLLSKSCSEIDIRHGRASKRKRLVLHNCRACDIVAILSPYVGASA